jgi:ParB family chromosome partitioning protein
MWERWQRSRTKLESGEAGSSMSEETRCLSRLLWAGARLGGETDTLVRFADARATDRHYLPLKLDALAALADSDKPSKAAIAALERAATGTDPEARTSAAAALARHAPARAAAIGGDLVGDRSSFDLIAAGRGKELDTVLRAAGRVVHYQGVALPHLVARGDMDALVAMANDGGLSEVTRTGAIEAIAKLATVAGEAVLVGIGADPAGDEELRKTAWRAVRRSKRARLKAASAQQEGRP